MAGAEDNGNALLAFNLHLSEAAIPKRGIHGFRTAKAVVKINIGTDEAFYVEIVDDKVKTITAAELKKYLKAKEKYAAKKQIIVAQGDVNTALKVDDEISVGSSYLIKERPKKPAQTVEQKVATERTKLADFVARHQSRLETLVRDRDAAAQRLAQSNESILEIQASIAKQAAKIEDKIGRIETHCHACNAPGPATATWVTCPFCNNYSVCPKCGAQALVAHQKAAHATPEKKRPHEADEVDLGRGRSPKRQKLESSPRK